MCAGTSTVRDDPSVPHRLRSGGEAAGRLPTRPSRGDRKPLLYLNLYLQRRRSKYHYLLNAVREEGGWEEWVRFLLLGPHPHLTQRIELEGSPNRRVRHQHYTRRIGQGAAPERRVQHSRTTWRRLHTQHAGPTASSEKGSVVLETGPMDALCENTCRERVSRVRI